MAQERNRKRVSELRKRAEKILAEDPQAIRTMAPVDIQKLIHELNVHQIELEMQNEEYSRVQLELQEARDKYLGLYDFAPTGYFTLDHNSLILDVNLAGSQLLGSEKHRLIGAQFTASISPDSQDAFHLHYREGLKTSIKVSCELKMLKADGTLFHAQLISLAVPDKEGNINQYRTAVIDITERKQAEQSLQVSEENFRNSIDNCPLGIRIVSEDGETLYTNQAFLDIYGYKDMEEFRNTAVKDRYTPESYLEFHKRREKRRRREHLPDNYEVRIVRKDGEIRRLHVIRKGILWGGKQRFQTIYNDITEQKQTEDALRESEARYKTLFESAAEGILIADIETKEHKYANPAICKMLGYSQEELIKTSVADIHPKDSLEQVFAEFNAQARGEKELVSLPCLKKDGTIISMDINASKAIINGRECNICFFTDTTERKQAEERIRLFSTAVACAVEAISIADMKGAITYVNPAMEELYGYKKDEMLGIQVMSLNANSEMANEIMSTMIKQGGWISEFESKKKNGETFSATLSLSTVRDEKGKPIAMMGTIKDITERKQAEEALKLSEQNFRNSLDSSTVGIRIMGDDNSTAYANQALLDMFGYENIEELKASLPQEHYTLESHAAFVQRHEKLLRGEPLPELLEFDIIRKNGAIRHLQLSSREMIWNGKQQFQLLYRDITERKQAEKEKQELEAKAQVASRLAAVGEMAAGIAHEINNPLTSVLGFSQLLLEKQNIPEEIKEELKIITDGSLRVADIVKRLLIFARQTKPIKTLANLNELIENTLKLRDYVLKTANIEVVTRFDPELPWSIVDPGQLQQVFLNLIVNAEQEMKKAHGKGTLTITTEKKENNIRMSFKDDGPGIAKENLGHLFEPFFTTKAIGEGTGLGLSLSRSIVLEHNGTLNVESVSGHGATFIIELPIIKALPSEAVTSTLAAKVEPAAIKNGKILVVDDEPGVRALLEKVLTQSGHSVETIGDASKAIDKLDAGVSYDVILTDARMPGMSGIEMYSRIIEKTPEMKNRIIFITGDVMGADIKVFLTQNKLPSLAKPFDIEILKEKINSIIMAGPQENASTERGGK
jgi:PAS domain S-box-containing protein